MSIEAILSIFLSALLAILGKFLWGAGNALWVWSRKEIDAAVKAERNAAEIEKLKIVIQSRLEMLEYRQDQTETYLDKNTAFNKRSLPGRR